ncbi:MAG: hypothetical protein ACLQU5_29895 [Isosphaeraceae bacterium]
MARPEPGPGCPGHWRPGPGKQQDPGQPEQGLEPAQEAQLPARQALAWGPVRRSVRARVQLQVRAQVRVRRRVRGGTVPVA